MITIIGVVLVALGLIGLYWAIRIAVSTASDLGHIIMLLKDKLVDKVVDKIDPDYGDK